MLHARQTDLAVCLENVHKPHNVAAIMRTCDAVGVHRLHCVWEQEQRIRRGTSVGAQQWVETHHHKTIEDAVTTLRQAGMQILVTHFSPHACDFRQIDYTRPTAIMLGQEKYGVTDTAIASADQHILVPMLGMVQSLNVSVAGALILYEAQRQRCLAGQYDHPQLDEATCQRILFEQGYPRLKDICIKKKLAYPAIDDTGAIVADEDWWNQIRAH